MKNYNIDKLTAFLQLTAAIVSIIYVIIKLN
jgi:hypothetical protein